MTALLLHESTRRALDDFIRRPSHGLLLIAPAGSGKGSAAQYVAAGLLGTAAAQLAGHPYCSIVRPVEGKSISIDTIREIIRFTTLRITSAGGGAGHRVVIIEDAQRLTLQAQNALLKTVEEPPAGTTIILTAPDEQAVLATIRSRLQRIMLRVPDSELVQAYFEGESYPAAAVTKALLMSGGLPGLMHALLSEDTAHPLFAAATTARDILQQSAFDRLVLADSLAKQRQLWMDVLFVLSRMADVSLRRSSTPAAARRWQRVLSACYAANLQTESGAQLKLAVLNFMLTI